MNRRSKLGLVSVFALAIILVPLLTVSAYAPTPIYPKGTVCGDAQLGHWVTEQYDGQSNFHGFNSLFTVNDMVLSGGNSGTVTGSSGTIKVYDGHKTVFAATFTGLSGTYGIKGKDMRVSFKLQEIEISVDTFFSFKHEFNDVRLPAVNVPCTVTDEFQI